MVLMGVFRAITLAYIATGCARAAEPTTDAGATGVPNTGLDAPSAMTLRETTDAKLAYGTSIACSDSANGHTRDNTWARVFQLSDFAVATTFHVASVQFAVQEAAASLPITVTINSYSGAMDAATLDPTKLAVLAQATTTPPDTPDFNGEVVNVPMVVDIAAGTMFVVEVAEPDMNTTGYMYIGATKSAESHPGYIASTTCSAPVPESTAAAGANGQIIIEVVGTHD
jgi:hypothetical protein